MKSFTTATIIFIIAFLSACGGGNEKGQTIITELEDSESANLINSNNGEVKTQQPTVLGKWRTSDGSITWDFTSNNTVIANFGGGPTSYGYSLVGNSMNITQNGQHVFEHFYSVTQNTLTIWQDKEQTSIMFPFVRDN